jgi:hypothetical protein
MQTCNEFKAKTENQPKITGVNRKITGNPAVLGVLTLTDELLIKACIPQPSL